MSIRILLADDHTIMQAGLRSLLEKEPDMEVVAQVRDGRSAVQMTKKLAPDVVIMDISMNGLNGIDATRQIMAEVDGVKIIALSMHRDEQFVAGMLGAGASGYLLKDCAADELTYAIRAVIADHTYLSPGVASIVTKEYIRKITINRKDSLLVLTEREREVLQLLSEGKPSKDIAKSLHLSVRTVETHRRQIMQKLDIHSVAELTKYAIKQGITSLDI
jgi:two-component system, NarL family, response regulator NreC